AGGEGRSVSDRRRRRRASRGRCRSRRGVAKGPPEPLGGGAQAPSPDEGTGVLVHFARVVGTVVCTEKVPVWSGQRLLLLEPTDSQGAPIAASPRRLVAVDLVSAAPGQRVFY